jgi:hypothetical protein
MPDDYDAAQAIQRAEDADQPIAKQRKLIAQQRELIARMAAGGLNIADASAVLAFMLDVLQQMEMDRQQVDDADPLLPLRTDGTANTAR